MPDLIGWLSSILLLATISVQIRKQWRESSGRGVSPWLYVGQALASSGFTVYSALLRNWVFILTNALLAVMAIAGLVLTLRFRSRQSHPSIAHDRARPGASA